MFDAPPRKYVFVFYSKCEIVGFKSVKEFYANNNDFTNVHGQYDIY